LTALLLLAFAALSLRGLIAPIFHRPALALIALTAAPAWRRVVAGKG
jgi:hypothetical protein